jgi:ABC-type phosphate transport system substrate-binding protein
MTTRFSFGRLCSTSSVLALSVAGLIGASVQPTSAQTVTSTAIYGGGSSLVSLAMRQVMDCYNGATLTGETYTFSADFNQATPTPGLLPQTCAQTPALGVLGFYASVGSGAGQRGFISNDPRQLVLGGSTTAAAALPAVPPVFLETSDAAFSFYPFPRIDFGASDSPLPAALTTNAFSGFTPADHWENASSISIGSTVAKTYDANVTGAAIQIPLIEAPVAIVVNTNNSPTATWQIHSATGTPGAPGSAMQLSTAQLCAIFSGRVRDWNSTDPIAALDSAGATRIQSFMDDNTGDGSSAQTYTSASLPIQVVFRSDGSGTSFIITNYLANSCPQIDTDGSLNYKKIFTGAGLTYGATAVTIVNPETLATSTTSISKSSAAANLPSTTFATLIANIKAVTGVDVSNPASNPWLGGSGTAAVAAGVNNVAANANGVSKSGRIGYVSNDFAQPYGLAANGAPVSVSVQNEDLRSQGVYHPGDQGQTFVAPTPAAADIAFQGLSAPASATATYADWNVYAQPHDVGTSVGGVDVGGKSRLGVAVAAGAYPISGTSFMYLYSCYNTGSAPTRVTNIQNFLNWFYTSPDATNALQNNGFNSIAPSLAGAIQAQYLTPGNGTAIADSATQQDGCSAVALNAGAQ